MRIFWHGSIASNKMISLLIRNGMLREVKQTRTQDIETLRLLYKILYDKGPFPSTLCEPVPQMPQGVMPRVRTPSDGQIRVQRQPEALDGHQLQKLSLALNRSQVHRGLDVAAAPPPAETPLPPGYHLIYFSPASVHSRVEAFRMQLHW